MSADPRVTSGEYLTVINHKLPTMLDMILCFSQGLNYCFSQFFIHIEKEFPWSFQNVQFKYFGILLIVNLCSFTSFHDRRKKNSLWILVINCLEKMFYLMEWQEMLMVFIGFLDFFCHSRQICATISHRSCLIR